MAFTFNTTINSFYLSSMLPESVSITTSTEGGSATVKVKVDDVIVFETMMTAYGYYLKLYDLQSIIEEAIKSNNNATGVCRIVVTDGTTTEQTSPFTVLLSDVVISNPSTWLATHFLTTRKSFVISRTGKQKLSYYAASGETVTHLITATIRRNGLILPVVLQQGMDTTGGGLVTEDINVATLASQFNGTLLAFEVQRGTNRKMKFYVTDEEPTLTFLFLNGFNVPEIAALTAVVSTKRKMESSTAIMHKRKQKYDIDNQEAFEVETSALGHNEARWLSQLIHSSYAAVSVNGTYKEVLIDGEIDVSNADNATHRLKFKYEFATIAKYQ